MMSSSSSAAGSRSRGGGGPDYDGQGLPVRYRIGLLAYTPAVYCECKPKLKACRWISWSEDNPGRRYYRCQRVEKPEEDCKFFEWFDDDCVAWYKELLRDLRDAVWGLKKVVAKHEEKLEAMDMHLVDMQMEVEEKQKEVEGKHFELTAMQHELNAKQLQLTAMQQELYAKDQLLLALETKMKNNNQCFQALGVICLVLLIMLVVVYAKKP